MSSVRVIGIGNWLLGDEGVGVHVARYLQEQVTLPPEVEVVDGGTGGFALLELMQSADRVVLVDATLDGQPLGTMQRILPRYARDFPPSLGAHDIGLKDLLDAFYLLGRVPEIVLYAISIGSIQDMQTELSPELQGLLPSIGNRIALEW